MVENELPTSHCKTSILGEHSSMTDLIIASAINSRESRMWLPNHGKSRVATDQEARGMIYKTHSENMCARVMESRGYDTEPAPSLKI